MKTSMVVLTYNQLEYTKLCIDSIRTYTSPETYEIIIVDNLSTDGTREWLKEQPDLKLILNDENLGFPKGCNQGIEAATGELILLLNNDTVVTSHWLDNMITCLNSSPDIGAVGCVTNNCSYGQQISVPYDNSELEAMQAFAADFNQSNQELWEERLKLVGFCYLFRAEIAKQIGLLDEIFTPGNYEDDDYSIRIREAGYRLMLCRDTFIHHFGSVSFKQKAVRLKQLLAKNRQKFMDKWGFDPDAQKINFGVVDQLQENHKSFEEFRVLEVGCQAGGNLQQIRNNFPKASLYGVEKNINAVRLADKIGEVQHVAEYTGSLNYSEAFFDAIVIDEILCEVIDPWRVLDGLRKYLKPDGIFIFGIYNALHFTIVGDLLNGNWDYEGDSLLEKKHLRFFTLKEIRKLMARAGLEITNTLGIPFHYTDPVTIQSLSGLMPPELKSQLNIAEYIVTAKPSELPDILKGILDNRDNTKEFFEKLSSYNDKTIMDFIKFTIPQNEQFELFNITGVVFFENAQLKRVLPYFEQALEINDQDKEILFNTAYFLTYLGESEHAEEYISKLREVDNDLFYQFTEISCASIMDDLSKLEEQPLVSIVVRTKNRPELLARCIESLNKQIYSNIEVVIINDGGSPVDELIEKVEHTVQFHSNKSSQGRAHALKKGLELAIGKYVNFVDDDDLLYPNHVALLVHALVQGNNHVVYSDAMLRIEEKAGAFWRVVEKKKEYSRDFDAELLRRTNYVPNLTVMFDRELAIEAGGINEQYQVLEDWDFWIRLSQLTEFYHLAQLTSEYSQRINGDNATQVEGHTFAAIRNKIYKEQSVIF
ncbi:glycosyltransferase [Paenibacillus sp. JX-17]|uniref:Glycosyltransferase n=1 Tax=Paenibacillus lacisoli TaxID=3064525 RepID=A0ABT9CBD8_9BACL|nr:glycosyltransferase [Paenibacillus sp. JX-17]MDO7906573.1 glycosyltransferase [Paenibacillus sp. JX-17]